MKKSYFDKVLVANRGEIAIRIFRTLKQMGIKSVAIYSEADTNSLHVQMADEAIYVGPSAATESYLSIENVIKAIQKSGANAVHPGYGFLSENAKFATRLAEEKVTLIGPSAKVIALMGDKIEAKKTAIMAGVNIVPGFTGAIESAEQAIEISKQIGYPIMLKAASGGGGKGMRVVYDEKQMEDTIISASREAASNFTDGRLFLEKFITRPRHIEIQVLADKFGNVVCLGERECSIQRHHQKVIEEAPSIFIDEETRQKMYAQVKALVKKVKYYSAGTVEFIADEQKNFYFLEMNTRLQVEHCVSEMITGVDIVEQMVKIAAGQKLDFTQEDIKLNGWAIESRIYSEDPQRGFLPSSGRITEYREPNKSEKIRIDSGLKEGNEVSMFYDPMIAKLCTYGNDREEAINLMKTALGNYIIRGVSHNMSFLEAIITSDRFAEGDLSTNFIQEEYPEGFLGAEITNEISKVFLCVSMYIHIQELKRNLEVQGQISGSNRQISTRWVVMIDEAMYPVFIRQGETGYSIRFENNRFHIESNWVLGNNLFKGLINGESVSVKIEKCDNGYFLTHSGAKSKVSVRTPRIAELSKFSKPYIEVVSETEITSPISGKVVDIKIKEGDEVFSGQEVIMVEAMKMENAIYASRKGKVRQISIKIGESVMAGQLLVELE